MQKASKTDQENGCVWIQNLIVVKVGQHDVKCKHITDVITAAMTSSIGYPSWDFPMLDNGAKFESAKAACTTAK